MNNIPKMYFPHILLVEDMPSQAMRFKKSLEDSWFKVHWVNSGEAGLVAVHEQEFDLIVLDIELPGIDGFEVCRRLKADAKVTNIPVIMLTTRDKAKDAMAGIETGATDYIPKDPFAEAVLLATIRQMNIGWQKQKAVLDNVTR